ncbi:membrane-associated protein, putative, partial [Bodo saltans]
MKTLWSLPARFTCYILVSQASYVPSREFQMINVIGRQSCSRGIIAAYFDDSFWVVTPTMKATSFIDDDDLGADFGVILVHTIFAVLFFAVVVIASRLRKRVRMLFPSLPLGVVYILFIGATNAAWRSAILSDKPGPAVGSMVLWVVFFLAIGATVWRIRSPRGLLFLRYHRGLFSWVLRGTHSPLQLRGKYSLMIDLWHENFVEFASPIHLLHLSISSIVCAFSSGSPLLCFPVLGTQMVWQSLVFLMTLFSLPGRSPFQNSLLILHSLMPLFLIAAATLSLDCLMAKNFYLAEWFTVITLVGYFLSAVLQVWMSFVERRYRADVERELKDITAKHRRIVFFMDDAGLTDQRDRLPPISKHFITPKLIDPDWRSKRHKDMFSFPLLRETDAREGDAWSSALTGMTAASAAERLRQSKQNTTSADNGKQQERWSTYEHIERGNGLNDDDDDEYAAYDDMMQPLPPAAVAENNNNSRGGVTVDAFGNSLRSDNGGGGAAAGGSSWVSARHDPTSAFTLKPLASQLRLNPYATSRSVIKQHLGRRVTILLPNNVCRLKNNTAYALTTRCRTHLRLHRS